MKILMTIIITIISTVRPLTFIETYIIIMLANGLFSLVKTLLGGALRG